MEAKDTVIKPEVRVGWDVDTLLNDQAEISFKAGMEEGRNFETHRILYRRGVGDGRREVVEWMLGNFSIMDSYDLLKTPVEPIVCFSLWISKNEWQDQLKEWGL